MHVHAHVCACACVGQTTQGAAEMTNLVPSNSQQRHRWMPTQLSALSEPPPKPHTLHCMHPSFPHPARISCTRLCPPPHPTSPHPTLSTPMCAGHGRGADLRLQGDRPGRLSRQPGRPAGRPASQPPLRKAPEAGGRPTTPAAASALPPPLASSGQDPVRLLTSTPPQHSRAPMGGGADRLVACACARPRHARAPTPPRLPPAPSPPFVLPLLASVQFPPLDVRAAQIGCRTP